MFKEEYITLEVPKSGDIRKTLSPLTYYSEMLDKTIKVPLYMLTDLGSIPQVLQGIFPKDGKAMFAYILHDCLYQSGILTRKQSDDVLEEAMNTLGVTWWRRKSVREGLRVGGFIAWNNYRKGITG